MNEDIEACPSCRTSLYNHDNQQIAECIKKQLEQFSKQEKEFLARYCGKSLTKETPHEIGGITIV
jgi:uncharacterized protein YbaR (Trm112 family)